MGFTHGVELRDGFPVPVTGLKGSGEIIDHLQKGETVKITMDQEFLLSDLDDPVPDTGRIVYQSPPAQVIDIVDFSGDNVPLSQSTAA